MALYLEWSGKNDDYIHSDVTRPTTKWHSTALALHRVENLLRCSMWYVAPYSNIFEQCKTSSALYTFKVDNF